MLTMWSDNVGAPLNIVHLGYGFGAVFANLFVKQFVGEENKSIFSSDSSIIETPYRIISIVCLLISIGHLIYSIVEYKNRGKVVRNVQVIYSSVSTKVIEEIKEIEDKSISQYSPRSCGNGYFSYGLSMSILWIFYMFFLSGNDQTFSKFFFAFLRRPKFSISTKGATWSMIIYWLSYSV
jgi:fucose permease